MLTKTMMQKIQDLKLQGYAEREIAEQLAKAGEKVPSKPVIVNKKVPKMSEKIPHLVF